MGGRILVPGAWVAPLRAMPGHGQDSLPQTPLDTGAFARGPTTFAHYTAPDLCRAAAYYTSVVQRRSAAAQEVMDTIRDDAPTRDTLPAQAIATARACLRNFTVAGTPASELNDLLWTAMDANEDSLGHAVVQRQLALARSAAGRDSVLLAELGVFLRAEPQRWQATEVVVKQIDALGLSAQAVRLQAHDSLLFNAYWADDTVQMRREAERILALGREVPTVQIKFDYDPLCQAYHALIALAIVEHPDSLLAVAARAKQDLQRFPSAKYFPEGQVSFYSIMDYKTATVAQVLANLSPIGANTVMMGQVLPPLQATYWFPKPVHWPPGSGPLSLVVYDGPGPCLGGINGGCGANISLGAGTIEAIQDRLAALLKRYAARYGPRGLAITVVAETWPGASLGGLPDSVPANVAAIRRYWQDHWQLPVTVAVVVDTVQQFSVPDGRLFPCTAAQTNVCRDQSANAQRYLQTFAPAVLLGRDGHLRYAGGVSPGGTPLLEAAIARDLAIDPSPDPSAGLSTVTPTDRIPAARNGDATH
jgi:hypothetical protein